MKSTTQRITPERERELWERIVDFLNGRFSDGDLYDILHHVLGMEHAEMEALGFALHDYNHLDCHRKHRLCDLPAQRLGEKEYLLA